MSWIWTLMFVALVANGIRLRGRTSALAVLAPTTEEVDPAHLFLVADGVQLSDATRRAASAHARLHGLQVLDVIPGDLSTDRAYYTLRFVNPKGYRRDRIGVGRGAGHAILVDREVWLRSRLGTEIADGERVAPPQMARATLRLKCYAPGRADTAVARDLATAFRDDPARALRFWAETFTDASVFVAGVHVLESLLLVAGLLLAPIQGLLALAAFQLQPLLVFGGRALRPHDLSSQAWMRFFRSWQGAMQLVAASRARANPALEHARREEYRELLKDGTARFFEPRRSDCPFCGSQALRVRLRTGDLFQQKPGRFTLEECKDCGHIFQNPRLSIEGLDFYYKDFYDGAGEEAFEFLFSASDSSYRDRAAMLRGYSTPRNWLDVGTGHGHFCLTASELWPETRFDGLDISASIEEAERRGWVTRGYRHSFPDLAPKLAAEYDVVSMHHYLEHTREPLAELSAAAIALRPGGYCLIEVPDPESPFGRLLGRFWVAWFQPQHQHFVPLNNLRQALEKVGFTILKQERGRAHIPADLSVALFSWISVIAPPSDQPWHAPQGWGGKLWRYLALGTLGPLLSVAFLIDQVVWFLAKRGWEWPSNAYRVLAQKQG